MRSKAALAAAKESGTRLGRRAHARDPQGTGQRSSLPTCCRSFETSRPGHTSLNSIAGQLNGTEPPLAQWCVVQRGVPQPARPRAARYALRSLLVDELNELNELSPLSLSPLVRFFRLFRSASE
jgi:hypothetical protein